MNLRRGDIFWADFGHKCRPYVVVQSDAKNTYCNSTIVVPLTTKPQPKHYSSHVPICWGSINYSIAKCEDLLRIEDPTGSKYIPVEHLPKEIMTHIDRALKEVFDLI